MARTPKDAIVLCLDVGPAMTQAAPGMDNPLQSSIKIIEMMVQRKIFSKSKDEIALVLFGTEQTFNDLNEEDEESYQNIHVMQSLGIPGFNLLKEISQIEPGPEETDFLDAITVGIDILHKQTQGKKIEFRRLVLFTNFDHRFSNDGLEGIIGGFCLDGEEVQLNVISPQFEEPPSSGNDQDSGSDGEGPSVKRQRLNPSNSSSEKPKTPQQRAGERLISDMFQQGVEGCAYSYEQAVLILTYFEKKSVRSMPWKCQLTLGSELSISCAALTKTKADTLKQSWTKCYAKTHKSDDITRQKYYYLRDSHQTEVPQEDIIKGYKYGKDVIPFNKEDENAMKYQTDGKCLEILGFTNSSHIKIQDMMDDKAQLLISEAGDESARTALSALVTALQNLNMCAVARYVYRKNSNPKLMVLMPRVKESHQCLVMVALPFAEDMRSLDFPSLASKKNPEPSYEQLSAIDSLIDCMDLCGEEKELYKPQETPNPYFQRVYHNLCHRALNPDKPLPPPDQRIENILTPNEEVCEKSRNAAVEVKNCFILEKVEEKPNKTTATDIWADVKVDAVKTEVTDNLAGGDASSQLSSVSQITLVRFVGSVTPAQDFLTLLKDLKDEQKCKLVFEQLQQRVIELVTDSFHEGVNEKVIPCLLVMREKAMDKKISQLFNPFMKSLKKMVLEENSKTCYWNKIVSNDISLIGDDISDDEVSSFLTQTPTTDDKKTEGGELENDEDVDDLLDEL